MYFPGRTQSNQCFASMQRTFYPKYVNYYGNGSGRDHQIIGNNGGLTSQFKYGMGHTGKHFSRYSSSAHQRPSPSPQRDATTFYYQSDGSGRDSYVLMDNGGLRPEYDRYNKSSQAIFASSLRNTKKSSVKYLKHPVKDRADITTYMNWASKTGVEQNRKNSRIQKAVVQRLSQSRKMTRNIIKFTNKRGSAEESQFKITNAKMPVNAENSRNLNEVESSPESRSPQKLLQSLARTSNNSPNTRSIQENNYDLYGYGIQPAKPQDTNRARLTSEVKEAYNNDFGTLSKQMNTTLSKQVSTTRYRNNQTVRLGETDQVQPKKMQ